MDFGYVRVSTKEQNPDRQIKKLLEIGIDQRNIYGEKKSGHTICREVYDMLLRRAKEGEAEAIRQIHWLYRRSLIKNAMELGIFDEDM